MNTVESNGHLGPPQDVVPVYLRRNASPPPSEYNDPAMMAAVVMLLEAMGEDPTREGLRETPRRVAQMYHELLAGTWRDPSEELQVSFEEHYSHMVIVKDIPFFTLCEHHLLPFFGVAHVGYLPRGPVVGISKLARTVELLARRLQLQERLTAQIANCIMTTLEPQGVGVILEGVHCCMVMRGVNKPGSKVVTSVMRGAFTDAATETQFHALLRLGQAD